MDTDKGDSFMNKYETFNWSYFEDDIFLTFPQVISDLTFTLTLVSPQSHYSLLLAPSGLM